MNPNLFYPSYYCCCLDKVKVIFPHKRNQVPKEYKQIFSFEDELTLDCGNEVKNIVKVDDYWWEGEFDGKRGIFPKSCVDVGNEQGKQTDL